MGRKLRIAGYRVTKVRKEEKDCGHPDEIQKKKGIS